MGDPKVLFAGATNTEWEYYEPQTGQWTKASGVVEALDASRSRSGRYRSVVTETQVRVAEFSVNV